MLDGNIRKLLTIKFFSGFMILMPVIVPFFQSTGIGMKGVYLLQSVFAITVFMAEVPSGYISDLLGRKKTLVLALFFKGVGFSLFPFADGLMDLVIAEVVLGIGLSLLSGTDTALMYDTLEVTRPGKAHIKVLGRTLSAMSLGEGLASLIAAGLMWWALDVHGLVVVNAFTCWIPFLVSLTVIEPPRKKLENSHKENFIYIFKSMFGQSRLLNLIMLNAVFSFAGTLIAVWMFQKYWEDLGIPLAYFGLLWAATNFVVSWCSRKAHKWEKQFGSAAMVSLIGFLPIAGFLGISLTDHVLGVAFCFCFQICRGVGQVILKDGLNKRVTADFRATANSILAMGTRVYFMFAGPIVGWVVDEKGLDTATLGLALFYTAIFALVLVPLLRQRRNYMPIK